MIYAKDNKNVLRQFTMDCPDSDLEQVSTFDKASALKMTVLGETGVVLKGAVLCLIKGGKL
jgi:hypothetical protein